MASSDGPASDHLNFFRAAASQARRFSFFALLRQAESRRGPLPPIARSRLPQQNVADLAHSPELVFPGPTVEAIEFTKKGRVRVRSLFLGLTGPMGPLPLHLSEFAQYERRYAERHAFGRFMDLLTDRMLQFFYRAWADSQPAVQADNPDADRFAAYLSALMGQMPGTSAHALPLNARLHYLGHFLSRRAPANIADFLRHLFGRSITVREFVPVWRAIEPEDQTRIGRNGIYNSLGRGVALGRRARLVDDTIVVSLQATNIGDYERFLPGDKIFNLAAEALHTIVPSHMEWHLELQIAEREAPGTILGTTGRLGWTTWLAPKPSARWRSDLRLTRRHLQVEPYRRGTLDE